MKVLGPQDSGASRVWTEQVSGTAWMDVLLNEQTLPAGTGLVLTSVTFPPGARTLWHRHEGGQLLLVVAGRGWVGSHQDGPLEVTAGDVVWTPPGQDHWHGATDTTTFTHLAVTLGHTAWSAVTPDLTA